MREESDQKGGGKFARVGRSPPVIARFAVERGVSVAGVRVAGTIDVGVALCGVRRCDSRPEWVDVAIRLADWVEAILRNLKQGSSRAKRLLRSMSATGGRFLIRCAVITPVSDARRLSSEAMMAAWSDWPSVQHGVTDHLQMSAAGTENASSWRSFPARNSVGLWVAPGKSMHMEDLSARSPLTSCARSISSLLGAGMW